MRYALLLLLLAAPVWAGSYDLAPIATNDDQDAAVLRIALRQCAKGDSIEGLDAQCQGTPTQAGLNAMLARRLGNVIDSEVLQHLNDRAKAAAEAYVLDQAARQAIEQAAKPAIDTRMNKAGR